MSARDPLAAPLWHTPDAVTFTDADGLAWRVVETACADVPGARGPWCLIFLAERIARRVWTYPADWRRLSAGALARLGVDGGVMPHG